MDANEFGEAETAGAKTALLALEAFVEAALDAGAWKPDDCEFVETDQIDFRRSAFDHDIVFVAAHVGIVARLLADPRACAANAVDGWYSSGRSWFGDSAPGPGCRLSPRRQAAMFEVLAADARCRAELARRRPRVPLEAEENLLAGAGLG